MASFVAVVDPDADRRIAYLQAIEPRLSPQPDLARGHMDLGNLAVRWAAAPCAPVSTFASPEDAGVIWGDAIGPAGRTTARELAAGWLDAGTDLPCFGGFHAAVAYRAGGALTAGVDLMGVFPLYYAGADDFVIVASSPELIWRHARVNVRMDPRGLVGVLLTHGAFEGRTLIAGVRRLGLGEAVSWHPGAPPRTVRQWDIPVSVEPRTPSFEEGVDQLHDAFRAALRRHAPPQALGGILLSGGRDSRLIAGYLQADGHRLRALTIGHARDYEALSARRVAAVLGWPHAVESPEDVDTVECALRQARWEHLSTGFGAIHHWGIGPGLDALAPRFATGLMADWVLGGASLKTPTGPNAPFSFEQFFSQYNLRGLQPGLLARLLRPPAGRDLVDETLAGLERALGAPLPPTHRLWRLMLEYAGRLYVGSAAWRQSFRAWPVLPVLDRDLLELVGSLPVSTLIGRRAEDALMCRHLPDLARIPLIAVNDYPTAPLLGGPVVRWWSGLVAPRALRAMDRLLMRERRWNYRLYDFNAPGWHAVRVEAEASRDRLADLFDMDELRAYLPPPGVTVRGDHPFFGTFGRKLLIGLMLWAGEHLP